MARLQTLDGQHPSWKEQQPSRRGVCGSPRKGDNNVGWGGNGLEGAKTMDQRSGKRSCGNWCNRVAAMMQRAMWAIKPIDN